LRRALRLRRRCVQGQRRLVRLADGPGIGAAAGVAAEAVAVALYEPALRAPSVPLVPYVAPRLGVGVTALSVPSYVYAGPPAQVKVVGTGLTVIVAVAVLLTA